jgi:hypothetical protein
MIASTIWELISNCTPPYWLNRPKSMATVLLNVGLLKFPKNRKNKRAILLMTMVLVCLMVLGPIFYAVSLCNYFPWLPNVQQDYLSTRQSEQIGLASQPRVGMADGVSCNWRPRRAPPRATWEGLVVTKDNNIVGTARECKPRNRSIKQGIHRFWHGNV